MSNEQTGSTLFMTAFLAAAFGLVAFGVARAVGEWDYSPAAFIGLGVAAVVWIFLLVAMHAPAKDSAPASPAMDVPAAQPAAPEPAPAPVAAPVAAPAAAHAAAPVAAPAAPVMAAGPAKKPEGLSAPRGGRADDLKQIVGIGPKLELLCHRLGYFHFDQIAAWAPAEVAWVDENLEGFRGRVTRDKWVAQAKVLAAGGTVAEAERVHRG